MLAVLVIAFGVVTIGLGAVLLAASVAGAKETYWNLGLPVVLAGQVLLGIGFVLRIDRLWHDTRSTAAKLDQVDRQLDELRSATALLSTSHTAPATSFYAHLAGGASPQVLLADLKGQLDLLALKLGQTDRS
jgi:hypothetical protein